MSNTNESSNSSSPRQPQEALEALYARMVAMQSSTLQYVCEFGKVYSLKLHTFFAGLEQSPLSQPTSEKTADKGDASSEEKTETPLS